MNLRTTPTEITAIAEALAGIHPQADVLITHSDAEVVIEADGLPVTRISKSDTDRRALVDGAAYERHNALAFHS